jgi:hypothetical protein
MGKSEIIYEEMRIITVKFNDPRSDDYLHYVAEVKIRKSGKNPVEVNLKFDGIPPFAAPMPPEEHEIRTESVIDLYSKLKRWFWKWRYVIQ